MQNTAVRQIFLFSITQVLAPDWLVLDVFKILPVVPKSHLDTKGWLMGDLDCSLHRELKLSPDPGDYLDKNSRFTSQNCGADLPLPQSVSLSFTSVCWRIHTSLQTGLQLQDIQVRWPGGCDLSVLVTCDPKDPLGSLGALPAGTVFLPGPALLVCNKLHSNVIVYPCRILQHAVANLRRCRCEEYSFISLLCVHHFPCVFKGLRLTHIRQIRTQTCYQNTVARES